MRPRTHHQDARTPRTRRILGGSLCLCVLVVMVLASMGCATLQVEAGFKQPAELTATAIAQAAPTPAPKPQLGRLAFVRGGDVWVRELPDGEARRLTRDGRNSEPRWSPSGQWLAIRKEYQLLVLRADGSEATTLNAGAASASFAWSPAEDLLAYTTGVGSLRVVKPGSPGEKELVPQGSGYQGTGVNGIAWSPDGEWIAYEWVELSGDAGQSAPDLKRLEQSGDGGPFVQEIRRIRVDGSESRVVRANRGPERHYLANWSPDGQWLLAWHSSNSESLRADGFPLEALPVAGGEPVRLSGSMLTHQDFLSWSPDARRLALVDGGGRMAWEKKLLSLVTPAGGAQRLSDRARTDLFPAWSPDGRWIAFTGAQEASGVGAAAFCLHPPWRRFSITRQVRLWRPRGGRPGSRGESPLAG